MSDLLHVPVTAPPTLSGIASWIRQASGVINRLIADSGTGGGGGGLTDGNYGDITVSGGGTVVDINPGAVGYADLPNVTASRLLGRGSAGGTGDVEELTVGTGLAISGTVLSATGGGGSADGLGPDGDKGDITVGGTGTTLTIDPGVVTLAKQADVATATVFYRKTAATGSPEVQTLATLKTDLGLTGTNSGDQTTVSGSAGSVANALTMNNGGAGVASGTTFDGSVARTLSYNTLGAAPTASPTFTGTVTAAAITASGDVKGNSFTATGVRPTSSVTALQMSVASDRGFLLAIRDGVGWKGLDIDALDIKLQINTVTVAAITSTGVAVTGALSCTGNATLGDADADVAVVNGNLRVLHTGNDILLGMTGGAASEFWLTAVNAVQSTYKTMALRASQIDLRPSGTTAFSVTSTGAAVTGTLGVTGTSTLAALNCTNTAVTGTLSCTGDLTIGSDVVNTAWTAYTPTVTPGAGAFTSVAATGRYKKIGKTVHVWVKVTITTNGTASTYIDVTAPVASRNSGNASDYQIFAGCEVNTTGKMVRGALANNGTALRMQFYDATYPGANGYTIVMSGTYECA